MLEADRTVPSRRQAAVFRGKATILQGRRWITDLAHPVPRHSTRDALRDAPPAAEVRAPLWNHQSPAEFSLTAGKIHNLRLACAELDGVEVPAGATFSFWKQVGRTTRHRGYTTGRELREGCLVPNRGGGLCLLSNLLYGAALDSGLEILERHAHSRTIPGSLAEADRDATIFWNYVDLRFRAPAAFRIEAFLTATELVVRIRTGPGGTPRVVAPRAPAAGAPVRAQSTGDCVTCGMTSCFRNPNARENHRTVTGHTAFLLDARWPEFDAWCARHSHDGDHWLLPLDPRRWRKPNYAWSVPAAATLRHATRETLLASLRMRNLPAQGAVRQRLLLDRDRRLARRYARLLDPAARHLVISQTLLPQLQRLGALGGRTYDVLLTRWPLAELQRHLDEAARTHPASPTLADFRADPHLIAAEDAALAGAARLLTPHRAIADHFGSRSLLLDWDHPGDAPRPTASGRGIFFPASPLGRKGIYELAAALDGFDAELLVLGRAGEDHADPLAGIRHRPATVADLPGAAVLVLPAWIEHEPRLALRALAHGIPVVATAACGLAPHPLLTTIPAPEREALRSALESAMMPHRQKPSQRAS